MRKRLNRTINLFLARIRTLLQLRQVVFLQILLKQILLEVFLVKIKLNRQLVGYLQTHNSQDCLEIRKTSLLS